MTGAELYAVAYAERFGVRPPEPPAGPAEPRRNPSPHDDAGRRNPRRSPPKSAPRKAHR